MQERSFLSKSVGIPSLEIVVCHASEVKSKGGAKSKCREREELWRLECGSEAFTSELARRLCRRSLRKSGRCWWQRPRPGNPLGSGSSQSWTRSCIACPGTCRRLRCGAWSGLHSIRKEAGRASRAASMCSWNSIRARVTALSSLD